MASGEQPIEAFLKRCRDVVKDSVRVIKDNDSTGSTMAAVDSTMTVQAAKKNLVDVQHNIQNARGHTLSEEEADELLETISQINALLAEHPMSPSRCEADSDGNVQVSANSEKEQGYCAPLVPTSRGPPRFDIPKEQLLFFVKCGYTTRKIAQMLGVHRSTIQRRLKEFETSLPHQYSTISDQVLDDAIPRVIHGNYQLGPNSIVAALKAVGLKVQRSRVRSSMKRIDPGGAALRAMTKRPHRRTYHVSGPNSLWHLDGNHKLIRWRLVVRGAIDGFSRLFLFLKASDNNMGNTVLELFTAAVSKYGQPARVRCDDGCENNEVCRAMERLGDSKVIRGASVHNQRIERGWVDVWAGVTNIYYQLFYFLEDEQILDPTSETDLWALHRVYLPRINQDLERFCAQWNNHGLRTERYQTPVQLFVSRSLELCSTSRSNPSPTPVADAASDATEETHGIRVPRTTCPLDQDQLGQLEACLLELQDNEEMRINTYREIRRFARCHV